MSNTKLDIRQVETKVLQDQLNATPVTGMDSTLASVNSELTVPGRLIAQTVPSLTVSVGSGSIANPNTAKHRVLPFIGGTPLTFAGGTITFPPISGSIIVIPGSGGSITIGPNQFVAVTVQLDTSSQLILSIGAAAGSLPAVVIPSGVLTDLTLGYIIVQSNGSGQIQNITNAMLYQTDMPATAQGITFDPNTILTGTSQVPILTNWVTDATNFTPDAGFGTVTLQSIQTRRVGDSLHVKGYWKAGTVTAAQARLAFTTYVIDSTKMTIGNVSRIGTWTRVIAAGNQTISQANNEGPVIFDGTTGRVAFARDTDSNILNTPAVTSILSNNDGFTFDFVIPVVGYTANNAWGSVLVNNDGNVLIA